jgi:DNA (cytosine-5)-methyltransferase 1
MDRQTVLDTLDQGKLNPVFVEYMMGLPKGWVTNIELLRSQKLKMLGNGVVPQQAYYAIQQLMELDTPSEQDLC